MAEELNAKCAICGKKYHVCRTCNERKDIYAWNNIVDTENHFKIYTILHQYDVMKTINKEEAKNKLAKCDLSELNSFPSHIKKSIKDIIGERAKTTTATKVAEK